MPFPHVLPQSLGRRDRHLPLLPLLRRSQRAMRSPLSHLFSSLDNPSVLSMCLPALVLVLSPTLDAFKSLTSVFYLGIQNCTQYSRLGRTNTKYSRRIISFDWMAALWLMHPMIQFVPWLPGHTAGSHQACCWPAPPGPFLQDCSRHVAPSLCLCLALLRPTCSAWHFPLLLFMLLLIAQCSTLCKMPLQSLSCL